MLSLREIRRRIKSVEKTKQITKAMQIVSATKYKRTEEKWKQSQTYALRLQDMLSNLSQAADNYEHPLFQSRETIQSELLVLITSDKGLCGSYNAGLIRKAEKYLSENLEVNKKLLIIGKKAGHYFRKKGAHIVKFYADFNARAEYDRAVEVMNFIVDGFNKAEWDHVNLLYANYQSAVSNIPTLKSILPFKMESSDPLEPKKNVDYLFEPNPQIIMDQLIPRLLNFQLYFYLLEAFTSEHSARMVSMQNATENAKEMIEQLTLIRNKARQAAITKEISEIVGGVEALKG